MMCQKNVCDVLIVGGGIFGLSIAYALQKQNISVIVLEKRSCGWGASGGILGALMPHVPDQWNAKKQFQFEALSTLPDYIRDLEAKTGIETGYRQCGRIIPLSSENDLLYAQQRQEESRDHWSTAKTNYTFGVHNDERFTQMGWLAKERHPFGFVLDTLAATIDPAAYVQALQEAVGQDCIHEGESFEGFDEQRGVVTCASGQTFRAKIVVLSAGFETFDILQPYYQKQTGSGIKGQATLLQLKRPLSTPLPPVLYDDGVYIIAKTQTTCAVGSTSENNWHGTQPNQPTFDSPPYLEKAKALCPALENAEVLTHWAGVRPRAPKRDPMIGRVSGTKNVYVATGGFKIGLGIAHTTAQTVVGIITETSIKTNIPESFRVEWHLS